MRGSLKRPLKKQTELLNRIGRQKPQRRLLFFILVHKERELSNMGILDIVPPGVITGDDVYRVFQYAEDNDFAIPSINVTSTRQATTAKRSGYIVCETNWILCELQHGECSTRSRPWYQISNHHPVFKRWIFFLCRQGSFQRQPTSSSSRCGCRCSCKLPGVGWGGGRV